TADYLHVKCPAFHQMTKLKCWGCSRSSMSPGMRRLPSHKSRGRRANDEWPPVEREVCRLPVRQLFERSAVSGSGTPMSSPARSAARFRSSDLDWSCSMASALTRSRLERCPQNGPGADKSTYQQPAKGRFTGS